MLWPARNVSFTTTLSKEEALARLHAEVARPKLFMLAPALPPSAAIITTEQEEAADFYGTPSPDGARFRSNFRLTSDGGRRISDLFDAETRCTIKPAVKGSVVHARIQLGESILAALLLLMASAIGVSLYLLSAPTHGSSASAITLLAVAVTTWVAACFLFSEHAQRTERLLRAGLERP
ncbi:MAG: hypothetical protein JNM47_11140 [Hyphomonadaceae bacterium]|nr:hypothetical protein [Hyphomonadaceae bacterium]